MCAICSSEFRVTRTDEKKYIFLYKKRATPYFMACMCTFTIALHSQQATV